MDILGLIAFVAIGILALSPIWIIGIHIKGIKEFCNLSPEEQLAYFGITDLGHTISLKSYILPNGENNSLVYDKDTQMLYFIHGRALKSNRSYESFHKDSVLSYTIDNSVTGGKPIIIKTSMISKPIIRVYCKTDTVVEEITAALDLILSNQPLVHLGQSMIKE
jgi:hypothetical protein